MKKSTIICIATLLLSNYFSFTQDLIIQPKHGIEAQFGANSPVISLKYQRYYWLNTQQHFTFSVGTGLFYGVNFNHDLTFSIGDGRSFLEVGILGIYTSSKLTERSDYRYHIFPMAGYKYISSKWIYARIHFSPYIENGEFYPYAGIGVGFYLKEKKNTEFNPNINTIRYRKD